MTSRQQDSAMTDNNNSATTKSKTRIVLRMPEHKKLKADHPRRPLWTQDLPRMPTENDDDNRSLSVTSSSRVVALDTSLQTSPDAEARAIFEHAANFLACIAEPYSFLDGRDGTSCAAGQQPSSTPSCRYMRLTEYSLYSAVVVSELSTQTILHYLQLFSKTPLSPAWTDYIQTCTALYGQARLVLRNQTYYIESEHPQVLQMLRNDAILSEHVLPPPPSTGQDDESDEDTVMMDNREGVWDDSDNEDEEDDKKRNYTSKLCHCTKVCGTGETAVCPRVELPLVGRIRISNL